MTFRTFLFPAVAGLTLALAGCNGDDHDHDNDHDDETIDEHACEELEEGHSTTVTAHTERDQAPEINLDEPYTVNLPTGEAGYVKFHLDHDEDLVLFVDTADVITGLFDDHDDDELTSASPNPECPDEIPEHYDLHLHDGDYFLRLGPAAVESVWIFLAEDEEHGH